MVEIESNYQKNINIMIEDKLNYLKTYEKLIQLFSDSDQNIIYNVLYKSFYNKRYEIEVLRFTLQMDYRNIQKKVQNLILFLVNNLENMGGNDVNSNRYINSLQELNKLKKMYN